MKRVEHSKTEDSLPLLTVPQLAERHPAWSVAALRNLIFRSKKNGLDGSGALIKVGRRVLISEPKFLNWVLIEHMSAANNGGQND